MIKYLKTISQFKLFSLLFAAYYLFTPVASFAVLPSDDILDFYSKNGIYYYNPSGNDECETSSTKLSGSDTAEKIWNFFIDQGFSDAQVAGLLGNAMVESGIQATRASNSSYWGLFQWGMGRKDALFTKIREAGLEQYLGEEYWASGADEKIPAADLDRLLQVELEFTMSETDLDWQNELKKATTPEMAAEIFLVLFERAVGGESEVLYYSPYAGRLYQATKARRDYAKEFYEQYSGKGVGVTSSSSAFEDGSNISIIGDSITVGSTSALLDKFTNLSADRINARVSRPWNEGVDIARNINNNLKNIVVFALGTNNPNGLSQAMIDSAISAIGPNKTIVFVTNYGSDDYSNNNNLLQQYAKENSNIIIADWYNAVAQNPFLYLDDDQIHPNESGTRLFADTIYNAINGNLTDLGCDVGGEFQSLVKAYAWPEYHAPGWLERMPDYASAVTQSSSEGRYVGGSVGGVPGIDCGGFVTILAQNSGLAPDYNDYKGGTPTQERWVNDHHWQLINNSPTTEVDTSLLQPGDIAFSDGHTFIYVGEIPGFDSVIASASYTESGTNGRAPMAGKEDLTFGNGAIVRWYRNPNFNPNQNTTSTINTTSGSATNNAPETATLLSDHHITFYSALASENGGYAGRNASSDYNNGYLAPGQAASNYLPFGTVVYVQTQSSGEASYANGKYFLITDRGAGTIDGDYNLDIFHDVTNSSENNSAPYGSSSTAKIWKVAENVSWETFKAKYGW